MGLGGENVRKCKCGMEYEVEGGKLKFKLSEATYCYVSYTMLEEAICYRCGRRLKV
jgi:hypothetical protein